MALYESIATVYESFFPPNPATLAYLERLVGGPGHQGRALDLGCATGGLVRELAARGWEAIGIETSRPMLDLAQEKAQAAGPLPGKASFLLGTMLEAEELLGLNLGTGDPAMEPVSTEASRAGGGAESERDNSRFDLVFCLGNTLPHLVDVRELSAFLAMTRKLLRPEGYLILQLLNYAKPGAGPGLVFPELRGGGFVFRRHYEEGPGGRIRFVTELSSEDGISTLRDDTLLLPIKPAELRAGLASSGFGSPLSSSGWESPHFDEARDQYLVASARARP